MMKKGFVISAVLMTLLAGCGNNPGEVISPEPEVCESETIIDAAKDMSETELSGSDDVVSAVPEREEGADSTELSEGRRKITACFDGSGRLILDHDGLLYPFAIDAAGALDGRLSDPRLVFGEAYEETRYYGTVTLVPIEYAAEGGNVVLGTLHGNNFEPNTEYFDESCLPGEVTGENICGCIDSIAGDTVSVFVGEENWLHQDTYLELINLSDAPVEMSLAEDVRYVVLDGNYRSVEATAVHFRHMLEQYAEKEKPAGPIFYLSIVDDEVVQIWEHFNP